MRNIHILARLPGLQNILRAKLLAIHHTLQLLLAQFSHEPAYIFIDCLNTIYLVLTQMQHPTWHNSHPDKTLLQSIIHMLTLRTQPTTLIKVKAHAHIHGNESADKLAKKGTKLPHRLPCSPHEHAYPMPYHLHKDIWPWMDQASYKGPIRHLQLYLIQYDKDRNLDLLTQNFPNIYKWINDPNIDLTTSTNFWTHPSVSDSQCTCILKFRYNQYMSKAYKQLFFGLALFPTLHILYATPLNRTPGNTIYHHVHSNTYMPYASKDIIK